MPAPAAAPPPALPCPAAAGWELVARATLPRVGADGTPFGGYSAAAYESGLDRLWLLSDLPKGRLEAWGGLRRLGEVPLRPLFAVPLRGSGAQALPEEMDGEGLVLRGDRAWVASEGRRSAGRPAQLLSFALPSGLLRQVLPLPPDWQPAPGRGLEANRGPESLALLRRSGRPDELLMAAETPLLQDPRDQVRLLRWRLEGDAPTAAALPPLVLPQGEEGWGLTDLLVMPGPDGAPRLLGLLRRWEPPTRWSVRLALYPLPEPAAAAGSGHAGGSAGPLAPVAPLAVWDLSSTGLPQDNWEALTPGPLLPDGRPSLLLASDDNLNPLQNNHLVLLAPRRGADCAPRHR